MGAGGMQLTAYGGQVAAKLISRASRPAPPPVPPQPSFGSSILSALSGVARIFAPRRP